MGNSSGGFRRSWPHLLQNLKPGGGVNPQFGQLIASDEPQPPQNRESSGLSNLQLGHFILRLPLFHLVHLRRACA